MHWVGPPNVANYRLQMSAEIHLEYRAISIKQSHCVIRQTSAFVSCRSLIALKEPNQLIATCAAVYCKESDSCQIK